MKKYGQTLGEYKLKKLSKKFLLEAVESHTDLLLSIKKVDIKPL